MDSSSILLLLVVILSFIYYYLTYTYDYFKKQNVKCTSGILPGVGNILPVLLIRENISTVCNKLYKKCSPDTSMIGMFYCQTPLLVIRDPELIKTVLIKDFQCFLNNMTQLNDELDPFMAKNPFFAINESWKESRTQIVNNMSQKKLKSLFRITHQVSSKFETYMDQVLKSNDFMEVDLKDTFIKFTGEVVANTAFGIEGHNLEVDSNSRSFNAMMEKFFEPVFLNSFKQLVSLYLPNLANLFRINFMPKAANNFLIGIISDVLNQRKEKGIVVDDFLQMTIEATNGYDLDVISRHISSYFFDAYETTATIAAFSCYRLSYYPEIQEKARQEIDGILNKYEGTLCYEALKDMKYLDQILNETIRLHPIIGVILRACTKRITLKGSDGQSCCLEPGHLLCIPVQSLHTDEQYWKDPEVFDPDRFSEERKIEMNKLIYLPFSEGPRKCAGMRYGIMTVKTILIMILKNCLIEASPKMNGPLKYDQTNFLTAAEGGLWAKLKKIDHTNK